jgi:hypothetical protein
LNVLETDEKFMVESDESDGENKAVKSQIETENHFKVKISK